MQYMESFEEIVDYRRLFVSFV